MNKRKVPLQKPGRSKQDYQTPPEFLAAVKQLLGINEFAVDLAASATNTAAAKFYDESISSLSQVWRTAVGQWAWLNPPYGDLKVWVRAAWGARHDANIAMLVPAGVGSNWWRDYVHQKALVYLLNGRITFVGQPTCYPKDCCLLLYGRAILPRYEVWDWRGRGR